MLSTDTFLPQLEVLKRTRQLTRTSQRVILKASKNAVYGDNAVCDDSLSERILIFDQRPQWSVRGIFNKGKEKLWVEMEDTELRTQEELRPGRGGGAAVHLDKQTLYEGCDLVLEGEANNRGAEWDWLK